MKKKILIPIIAAVVVIVVVVAGGIFIEYRSENSTSSMLNNAINLMNEKNYSGALNDLNQVLVKDPENAKAKEIQGIIKEYDNAETAFNNGNFTGASVDLSNLNPNYVNYSIVNDVNKLKNQIKEQNNIQSEIDNLNSLCREKKFTEASNLIIKLQGENLTSQEKITVEQIKNVVDEGKQLAAQDTNSSATSQTTQSTQNNDTNSGAGNNVSNLKSKYINELNNMQQEYNNYVTGQSQIQMDEQSGQVYTAWNNKLNEIWKVLQENLPKDRMSGLTESEVNWINFKNEKIKQTEKQFQGGSILPLEVNSVAASLTEKRCYFLVNNYM